MQQLRSLAVAALALVACMSLGACQKQLKKAKSELFELSDLLPGKYNNIGQTEADAKAGRDIHPARTLDIVRLELPLLSDYAYYAQESSADDSRQIISQRLLTFEATEDGSIVERVFNFAQPARWRDGHLNTGVFTSMMFRDTTPLSGCDLLWKKDNGKFVGQNVREACRVNSPAVGTVKVEMRSELSVDELALAELSYNVAGKLMQGNAADPFTRFQRAGGP